MPPFDADEKPGRSKAPDWVWLILLVFGSGTFGPQLGNMMPGSAGEKLLTQVEELHDDLRDMQRSISEAEDRAEGCCRRVTRLELRHAYEDKTTAN